jgi:hypothetical protein
MSDHPVQFRNRQINSGIQQLTQELKEQAIALITLDNFSIRGKLSVSLSNSEVDASRKSECVRVAIDNRSAESFA